MRPPETRRPRLALPFTIVAGKDAVRLVGGEDFRYTLSGPGVERWLPGFLAALDGRRQVAELVGALAEEHRGAARLLVENLYGERVLVDGSAAHVHPAEPHRLEAEGSGRLLPGIPVSGTPVAAPGSRRLRLLCQDRLDYGEALRFNEDCLRGRDPWMWASYGPMQRGYVSPAFLPDAGPCLACLLRHFRRLSPAAEIHDALLDHAAGGGAIEPVPFPEEGVAILRQLIAWKAEALAERDAPAALYRLHVLEVDSMEVTSHRVWPDPECSHCAAKGSAAPARRRESHRDHPPQRAEKSF